MTIEIEASIDAVHRLVQAFEQGMITEITLIAEVTQISRPDNVATIMNALPEQLQSTFRTWIARIPEPNTKRVVYSPLSAQLTESFKDWLKRQEDAEKGCASE